MIAKTKAIQVLSEGTKNNYIQHKTNQNSKPYQNIAFGQQFLQNKLREIF